MLDAGRWVCGAVCAKGFVHLGMETAMVVDQALNE